MLVSVIVRTSYREHNQILVNYSPAITSLSFRVNYKTTRDVFISMWISWRAVSKDRWITSARTRNHSGAENSTPIKRRDATGSCWHRCCRPRRHRNSKLFNLAGNVSITQAAAPIRRPRLMHGVAAALSAAKPGARRIYNSSPGGRWTVCGRHASSVKRTDVRQRS